MPVISDYPLASGIDPTSDLLLIEQSGVYNSINRDILLEITGDPLGTTDIQTVSNKTLGNTNTITVKDSLLTLQDNSDITKQAQFQLSGITAGQTRTYTLPDASTTLVGTGTTQTLTAKTLTSPTITGGSIANSTITVDSIAGYSVATTVTVGNVQLANGVIGTASAVVANSIAASAVVPNKILSGTGTAWPMSSWTVTWTNVTVGNGTVTSKYIQIGKNVYYRLVFVLGSTSSVASGAAFSLPVTKINYGESGSGSSLIGDCEYEDTGAANYIGKVFAAGAATTGQLYVFGAGSTYVGGQTITNTVPFTWASGDSINVQGWYEAA